ncbi:MAG: hypothetical protein SFU56_08320 [Capsulimonadales bacterium]|nr:hypothetical protein [Capsulimonadales bacterium]
MFRPVHARHFLARFVFSVTLLLTLPVLAQAQLSFSLVSDFLEGTPNSTLTFTGSLTNNYNSRLYLNSLAGQFSSASGDVTVDTASFFDYAPVFLEAGQTYNGNIFDVLIAPTATTGQTYDGQVLILGGFAIDEEVPQAFRDILVQVNAITVLPEPATGALALPLLGAITILRRRFRAGSR